MLAARSLAVSLLIGLFALESADAGEAEPASEAVRAAVSKALALLDKSSREYRKERDCFSCHHQALPTLALVEARRRGFSIDEENLQAAVALTVKHLENGRERYLDGRGQGGKADTAGYALWALSAAGWKGDETTTAVAQYLVSFSQDDGYWKCSSHRPPSEASHFTTTFLALQGLKAFGTDEQQEHIAPRRDKARAWLKETPGKDTEDRVFRLRALRLLEADEATIRQAASELLATQREDGGWSQTETLDSDAYATGSALVALVEAGGVTPGETAYRRGVQYLLQTQLDDGSWRVVSRSKPFQTYFESGFPHGKDQFISIAASSWATLALLEMLPQESP